MAYWIAPHQVHRCSRCGEEITLESTCVVGPGDEENWPPDDEPTMRVTLACSRDPMCFEFSFPLGPLIDPDGVAIEKRDVPDPWIPDSFADAIGSR